MIIAASVLAVIAWGCSFIEIWTDLAGYTAHFALFGRSGAVLTLCGVVLGYKISTKGQEETFYSPGAPVSLGDVGKAALLADGEKRLRYFAHITVIIGTLIWGFGDLLPEFVS
ncbi:hypothetical protein FWJ25_11140 [Marinobacter salinexigens]|uniref:Uncharacterized protein n=1 Tax=Marinobacter salinexigens TaxID=2919747 RepID=A0A5B0VHQ7_9GAMM|nr:hypothetical protein [Marinobacter salinexigens]KAA1173954.1 hypothetical protein FWJ25_11140 [Marinobacter salinexigens]